MKTIQRVAVLGGDRIPFARYNTAYKDFSNQQMFTQTLSQLVRRFDLQGQRLGEVVGGAVLKHAKDFNLTRESALGSGLSAQTPAYDLQQACATSIQATVAVANKIALGQIEVGIAGGVDSASDVPLAVSDGQRTLFRELAAARSTGARLRAWSGFRPAMLKPKVADVDEPRTGLSMGQHTERMVREWNVSREEQDALALASHRNGVAAYARGFYRDLLTPFGGLERDGILRPDTSLERLAKLAPAYDKTSGKGTLTAGNSTPLTDGAASVLLASEAWAAATQRQPLAWLVDAETAAVDFFSQPSEGLLMAPAHAVARLLARNQLTLADFDYYEIHEAFAGQVLCTLKAWESADYCRTRLGLDAPLGSIDRARLNINGGSVGLGHPFAATGARIVAAAAKQLAEHRAASGRSGRTLISVCAAGGLGVAAILEG
ncbi:acetyl-CoA C-acetyltransferase [Dyella acidiphila]|uniref:Acetyl-CoA C-acetyltransferase n=1 Tax=Dyella acidiphila TaxID=2775866 RepID=A0ABR9G9Y8_9GAMM|nr:acetyl-CoA C-acetyltransferase [Dyella acidiphila]MBE1160845.1 acetyl-CoA C-acetyltransferase [Dyella acidiphila]